MLFAVLLSFWLELNAVKYSVSKNGAKDEIAPYTSMQPRFMGRFISTVPLPPNTSMKRE